MRDLSSTIDTALSKKSVKYKFYANIYRNRSYFNEWDYDSYLADGNSTQTNWKGSLWLNYQQVEYIPAISKAVTFYSAIWLKIAKEGQTTGLTPTYGGKRIMPGLLSRSSVYGNYLYIIGFKEDGSGYGFYKYTVDWSAFNSGTAACLTAETVVDNLSGADAGTEYISGIKALSNTEVVRIYSNRHYTTFYYYNGTTRHDYPGRIYYKNTSIPSGTSFSTAVKIGSIVYIYYTDFWKGHIYVITYNVTTDTWSDPSIALFADSGKFQVMDAFYYNGKVIMNVHYMRMGSNMGGFIVSQPSTLLLSSSDYKIFSITKASLVTSNQYYYVYAGLDSTNKKLWYGSYGKFTSIDIPGYVEYPSDAIENVKIKRLDFSSGNIISSQAYCNLDLASNNDNLDTSIIKKNNFLDLHAKISTSSGWEDILVGKYIIDKTQYTYTNGRRSVTLQVAPIGIWNLVNSSYPFYTELITKQSIYEKPTKDARTMYVAPRHGIPTSEILLDMWNAEPDTYDDATQFPMSDDSDGYTVGGTASKVVELDYSASTKYGIKTAELNSKLVDYPVVTGSNVSVEVYSWCRLESGDTNKNPDEINVVVYYDDDSGTNKTKYTSSAWGYSAKFYPDSYGNVSVSHTFNFTFAAYKNPKIKRIGVIFRRTDSLTSHVYIERVVLGGDVVGYYPLTDSDVAWSVIENGADYIYKLPKAGRKYVMFSQKPIDAMNFKAAAKFSIPNTGSSAYAKAGIVGLAIDANNYWAGYYDKESKKFGITNIKNGSACYTIESSAESSTRTNIKIQFEYINGIFRLYEIDNTTGLYSLKVSHTYDSVDDGGISSIDDVLHVGIFGEILPPGFSITSFDASTSAGIPVAPGQDNETGFNALPASGMVSIDGTIYSYTSKTSTALNSRGPFQLRSISSDNNGWYADSSWYRYGTSSSWFQNYLLSTNGFTSWKISSTDWDPHYNNSGTDVYYRNRCRTYSDDITGTGSLSIENKVYFAPGLLGIAVHESAYKIYKHESGAYCHLYTGESIKCHYFASASGDPDISLRTMIDKVARYNGAETQFSGDNTDDSLEIT